MSFLNVKIMLLFYRIISQYDASIWLTSLPKMMCTYFPQIDEKRIVKCVENCFSLLKPVKVKFLRYFSLRFLLVQSCTYGTGWCFVCTIKLLSTCFFQITNLKKLKIFCAFRAAFGKQSNPETLKLLFVCFALTCKLILMERSVSHNETDIQKISN